MRRPGSTRGSSTCANHIATAFGLIMPEIRLTDNPGLAMSHYVIRIMGVEVAKSEIETDRVLVLLPSEGALAPRRGGR